MVEQIIMNLAVNSRDAMPKGGKLSVATRSVAVNEAYARQNTEAHPGQFVCLSVTDTGCGIDPHLLERIFGLGFTTKPGGRGRGLGLHYSACAARELKGRLTARSAGVGTGAAFSLVLPFAAAE